MAQVLDDNQMKELTSRVSRSVVLVKSFKRRKGVYDSNFYKCWVGFIVHVERGKSYVAVNAKIKKNYDLTHVYFHDNVFKEASVLIAGTDSDHTILEVEIEGLNYPKVNTVDSTRDDVLILAYFKDRGWDTFRSSVIIPDASALNVCLGIKLDGSEENFALGCGLRFDTISGAPVFDFSGNFFGIMSFADCQSSDLMFAQKATCFVHSLVDKIKEKVRKGTRHS